MKPVVGVTTRTVHLPRHRVLDANQAVPEAYLAPLVAAGAAPCLVPTSLGADAAAALLDRVDGLLLTGGGDPDPRHWNEEPHPKMGFVEPARDETEIRLIGAALERGLPILGICRGVQILNVALGGTLVQHLDPAEIEGMVQHEVAGWPDGAGHSVTLEPDSRLAALAGGPRARVTSSHHQAVGRVGEGLVVAARAPDRVIEALEHPGEPFVVAVQWHPERTAGADAFSDALFAAFVDACRRRTE